MADGHRRGETAPGRTSRGQEAAIREASFPFLFHSGYMLVGWCHPQQDGLCYYIQNNVKPISGQLGYQTHN